MIYLRMIWKEMKRQQKVQGTYWEGKIFHLPQDLFHFFLIHDDDKEEDEEYEEEKDEDEEGE